MTKIKFSGSLKIINEKNHANYPIFTVVYFVVLVGVWADFGVGGRVQNGRGKYAYGKIFAPKSADEIRANRVGASDFLGGFGVLVAEWFVEFCD